MSRRTIKLKIKERILRNKYSQKFTRYLGKDLNPQRWIFVIGCYNSGTTLLDTILQSHPDIQGLPYEGVTLTDGLEWPEEFGWTRMWHQCYDQMKVETSKGQKLAKRIKKQWSFWYSDEPQNYVEKSIANATRLSFLDTYFQPAYFIYIVRNGYAVSEGIRRKAKPERWGNTIFEKTYPIEYCARQWLYSDEVVQKESKNLNNFLSITYEQLTDDPIQTMQEITDFLGLSSLKQNIIEGTWQVQNYSSKIKNMNERSFEQLTAEDIKKIDQTAGHTLAKYNYHFKV